MCLYTMYYQGGLNLKQSFLFWWLTLIKYIIIEVSCYCNFLIDFVALLNLSYPAGNLKVISPEYHFHPFSNIEELAELSRQDFHLYSEAMMRFIQGLSRFSTYILATIYLFKASEVFLVFLLQTTNIFHTFV